MHVNELSVKTQDYLKALWDLEERGVSPAPMGEIAERVEQKASTATEATKRLSTMGLATRRPYAGVALTDEGRALAVQVVRRHRLTETLLVEVFGYTWDEVHDDAELLEHALSDRLLNRIDSFLGNPTRDPHGDPIPSASGVSDALSKQTLADSVGSVIVEQVNDSKPETLRSLGEAGIAPGVAVEVISRRDGLSTLRIGGREVELADWMLKEVRVT